MKNAIVLSITEDTQEIRSLLDTLEIRVIKEFVQKRDSPHKVGFLGPGRIEEAAKELKEVEADLIVVNGPLKPSQHHYLEMKFQMECIDRSGVILRIFADHAHTPEAIAQVTLAKLRYEVPFLREWIHKAKSGDRPGFLAGGAYATDVYYEHAKTHARKIENRLRELSRQREVTRGERRSKGYTLISLAGYTNAGKSALLNAMCNAEVEVDDRLFSTLSTTTRRVPGIEGHVLMTDTVGFIKDLPPELIKAFHSTLEEIFYADLIFLVVDSSEENDVIKMKLETSLKILLPKVRKGGLVVVANKTDLITVDERESMSRIITPLVHPYDLIFVSARTGAGLEDLRKKMESTQDYSYVIEARMPLSDRSYSLMSRIRSIASVSSKVIGAHLEVEVKCSPEHAKKLTGWLMAAGATELSPKSGPPVAAEEVESHPMEIKGPLSPGPD